MKNLILVLFLGLFACKTLKDKEVNLDFDQDMVTLKYLSTYQASEDTINGKVIVDYPKLGLLIESNGEDLFEILKGADTLLSGNNMKYSYLLEVFKDSFLVISFVAGESYASGPDNFKRDNIFIIDLKTGLINEVKLKDVLLTVSPQYLATYSPIQTNEDLDRQTIKRCAIEAIDFGTNTLILANQNLKLFDYKMIRIEKAIRHN